MSDVTVRGGQSPGAQVASTEVIVEGSRADEGGQQVSPTFTGVISNPQTIVGDGQNSPLAVIGVIGQTQGVPAIVAGANLTPGMPFYIDSNGVAQPAKNDTIVHASAIGLVSNTAPIGDIVEYALLTFLLLATSVWDSVTGQVGGLTPGASYYVGASAGTLTTTPPAGGNQVTRVGVAKSTTAMLVSPTMPVVTATP